VLASAADARTVHMVGRWRQERATLGLPVGGIEAVPGAVVSLTGSAPATLTIPANRFGHTGGIVAALSASGIVQLSTMLVAAGPTAPGIMRAGPKTTRPADFAFCPGAAVNPFCSGPDLGTSMGVTRGTRHGLIVYDDGPNQFGGTMQMLLGGRASLSSLAGQTGGGGQLIRNTWFPGATPTVQDVGGSYENRQTHQWPGTAYTVGAICSGGPCGFNGIVTVPGAPNGATSGSLNTVTGFPWTTGMLSAVVTTRAPTTNST
jgi:hypothetical protein